MKTSLTLLAALVVSALLASGAAALMPPHVTSISPGSGAALFEGRIVKFHGYTFLNRRAEVRDSGGAVIQHQQFLWSRQECRGRPGPCPSSSGPVATGAEQTYCVLSVKLSPPVEGASYNVQFLGGSVRVETRDGAYVVQ